MALNITYTKQRHVGRWIFVIVLLGLLGASGWYAYRWYMEGEVPPIPLPIASADASVDESDVTPAQVQEYTVSTFHPRYITIPDLGVSQTRILSVGIDKTNNQLQTPANINDTAWYNKSDTPGSGGVILINAHNGGITKTGIFAKLNTLQLGAEIIIERGDGQSFTYKVVENQSMHIDEVNATGMKMMGQSADSDKEGLNLITCDGKWVPRLGMFDRRIMLRAVVVE